MVDDLASSAGIDLATVQLDYEGFRKLGVNPNLSANERIGFPDSYRDGHDEAIFQDILSKLPALTSGTGLTVLDIGPGCARLPHLLIDICQQRGHRLYLVDSNEMLEQIPDVADVTVKRPGMFPRDFHGVEHLAGKVDAILCYSVFHYIFVDANPFTFLDRCIELLSHRGRALIGDIPNVSKRMRFFSSPAGKEFHRSFTGSDDPPSIENGAVQTLKIDDGVLAGLTARAQSAGCDIYLLPQPDNLPMANRREDLLVVKP